MHIIKNLNKSFGVNASQLFANVAPLTEENVLKNYGKSGQSKAISEEAEYEANELKVSIGILKDDSHFYTYLFYI